MLNWNLYLEWQITEKLLNWNSKNFHDISVLLPWSISLSGMPFKKKSWIVFTNLQYMNFASFHPSSNFNSRSYCFKFRKFIVISKAFLFLTLNGAQLNSQTLRIFMEASHLRGTLWQRKCRKMLVQSYCAVDLKVMSSVLFRKTREWEKESVSRLVESLCLTACVRVLGVTYLNYKYSHFMSNVLDLWLSSINPVASIASLFLLLFKQVHGCNHLSGVGGVSAVPFGCPLLQA